jgi:hypothetical protein
MEDLDLDRFGFNPETILVTFRMTSDGSAVWCRGDHKNTRTEEKCLDNDDFSVLLRHVG